ncbi:MAG TPA: MHYT domain-containing protein [Rhizomicrobium sp.]|nr:MHYT domain-containing protein [Rhizomicrobium sp.]
MLRVYGCIAHDHDLRLVALAGLLCLFACFTACSMVARTSHHGPRYGKYWIGAAALVAGCGIWATHFIGMLGFRSSLPIGYDFGLTMLSAIIAVAGCALGFALAALARRPLLGGAVTGLAICAMHYVGMAALQIPALERWDRALVAASLVIGTGFGMASFAVAARLKGQRPLPAGGLLALGICAMHFTAMAAVTYIPDGAIPGPAEPVPHLWLAVAATAVSLSIVSLGLIGALMDRYVSAVEAGKRRLTETARELERALAAANVAAQAKERFLAVVSHELRTPLNAVIGFSELIRDEMMGTVEPACYRDYAASILEGGNRLLELVNNILDITHLDARQVTLAQETVDLNGVVADCVGALRPGADRAGVRISFHPEDRLASLRCDGARVKQILHNLVANAVKFTPRGGRVDVATESPDGALTVIVADTGIGMAESEMAVAFTRFGQADNRLSRKYEGSGLGLPLAKELVELHGGQLTLESRRGEGTTVTVRFPPERAIREAAAA